MWSMCSCLKCLRMTRCAEPYLSMFCFTNLMHMLNHSLWLIPFHDFVYSVENMPSKALKDLLLLSTGEFPQPLHDAARIRLVDATSECDKITSDVRCGLNCQASSHLSRQLCPLCSCALRVGESLPDHLDSCEHNVVSCPHCWKGIAVVNLDDHIQTCASNVRCCYVCHGRFPSSVLADHLQCCGKGKVLRMYHGTSIAASRSIMQEGFRASSKGLLGAGVYVTKDPSKAKMYGPVIIECDVHVGATCVINKRHHNMQKCWAAHGYDSAWIPPQSEVVSSGMEEHCVADARRVVPVSLSSSIESQK